MRLVTLWAFAIGSTAWQPGDKTVALTYCLATW